MLKQWKEAGNEISNTFHSAETPSVSLRTYGLRPLVLTEAMVANEMQNGGSDLSRLKGFRALFDREMILVCWPESSIVIAFLFTYLFPKVFTINGNSSNTLQSDT